MDRHRRIRYSYRHVGSLRDTLQSESSVNIIPVFIHTPYFARGWNATNAGWEWDRIERTINAQIPPHRGVARWFAYWEANAGNAGSHAVRHRVERNWLV